MMGEIGVPEETRRRIFVAVDAADKTVGFITYVPVWGRTPGYLHDLTRRLGRLEESARFFKLYQVSKGLSTMIRTLDESVDALDQQAFCQSTLELAELVEDTDVVGALKERLPTTTMVSIGHRPTLRQWHDRRLELQRAPGEVGRLIELPAT